MRITETAVTALQVNLALIEKLHLTD
jgi:hypothetical protein